MLSILYFVLLFSGWPLLAHPNSIRDQKQQAGQNGVMNLENLIDWVVVCAYRLSTHAMLNWVDDPALLAIIFC